MINRRLLLAFTPLLLLVFLCRTAYWLKKREVLDGRDIIAKAIAAHGGEEAIAKAACGRVRGRTKGGAPGVVEYDIAWEETFRLPGSYKRTTSGILNGEGRRTTYVAHNRQGWIQRNEGEVQQFETAPTAAMTCYSAVLYGLLMFRHDACTFTRLPPMAINGKTAVGLKVTHPDVAFPMELYFDQERGLVVRSRKVMTDASVADATFDTWYSDFQAADGLKFPMKFTSFINTNSSMEAVVTEIQLLDSVPILNFFRPNDTRSDVSYRLSSLALYFTQ